MKGNAFDEWEEWAAHVRMSILNAPEGDALAKEIDLRAQIHHLLTRVQDLERDKRTLLKAIDMWKRASAQMDAKIKSLESRK